MIPLSKDNRPVYVIGHQNPDTDAICSAIGNAEFLRTHGEPNAVAARCGEMTLRTAWALEKAGVQPPVLLHDVTPTAGSICRRDIISVSPDDTFMTAYRRMTENSLQTIPVIDSEKNLHGLLRYFDLLNLLMPLAMTEMNVRSVCASLRNIAETIDGKCLNGDHLSEEEMDNILLVGASSEPSVRTRLANYKRKGMIQDLIVICGDRPNVQLYAVEHGVRALVTTAGSSPSLDIIETAETTGTCILSTPWDTASVGQLIRCSRKVSEQVHKDYIVFPENVSLPELRRVAARHKQDLFPVVSLKTKKIVGVLSKTDLVDPPRMRVVLVDHNEFSQAVKGIEEADIVEVLDHHRLGTQLSTRDPIRFLNEPVGSTSTLVARKFFHRNSQPSVPVAICLCAGILSDTLNLTSPTTTRADKDMLEWLTGIAMIDAKKFTEEFFAQGSMLRSNTAPSVIIQADRKTFTEYDYKVSLSQVEEIGLFGLEDVQDGLVEALEALVKAEGLSLACLLVTDIVSHNSLLLAVGEDEVLDNIEYERLGVNLFSAPDVVSRKKQLFPAVSRALKKM
ncbi:MAG: putative manganese-dependent inorganic diphosphatase [Akkermansia sp.]|nr:putative manganese-dependent inorganic diphosphatase [Akkermansia sp.]